jgi:hypothetical protein
VAKSALPHLKCHLWSLINESWFEISTWTLVFQLTTVNSDSSRLIIMTFGLPHYRSPQLRPQFIIFGVLGFGPPITRYRGMPMPQNLVFRKTSIFAKFGFSRKKNIFPKNISRLANVLTVPVSAPFSKYPVLLAPAECCLMVLMLLSSFSYLTFRLPFGDPAWQSQSASSKVPRVS